MACIYKVWMRMNSLLKGTIGSEKFDIVSSSASIDKIHIHSLLPLIAMVS